MRSSTRRLGRRHAVLLCGFLALAGCGERPVVDGPPISMERPRASEAGDAVPRVEPRSRYGNPSTYVVFGKRYYTLTSSSGFVERGVASWYGRKFHGRRTSSGEPYDMYAMTAAHKALPLPTYAQVTHLQTGKSIVVRINDRGPFHRNRIIDLSYAAATRLGMVKAGTALVEVRAIDPRSGARSGPGTKEPARGTNAAPVIDRVMSQPPKDVGIYLQVGAFASLANAERLRASLADVAVETPANIAPAKQGERTLYRVRLGPLADVDAADTLSSRLLNAGLDEAVVVLDDSPMTPQSY